MFSFIHSWLLDLILPRYCLGCHARGAYLCDQCLAKLPTENGLYLYDYNLPLVKKAIWRLKYKGTREIGRRFGQELHRQFGKRFIPPTTVIPIPLSKSRMRERGFNQAEVIAQGLVAMAPATYQLATNLLVKIKDTPTQVSIKSRAARLANLAGAFAVRWPTNKTIGPEQLAGQTIILIDDVFTTGGTLAEARRVLRHAGAKRVVGLTVAHG